MAILVAALTSAVAIALRPLVLAYLLLLYMLVNGLASRAASASFKLTIGSLNIFPLDFLFALMVFLVPLWVLKRMIGVGLPLASSRHTIVAVRLVSLFMLYQLMRCTLGFFGGVPLESLVRMFYADFQVVYFFLPLMFVRDEQQFRYLFYALIGVALLFPVGQVLFASREDAETLMHGQGTYRLGFGDSAIPLGIGLLAIYVWDRRIWLMALPAAGIVMIAHRSAFIAIFIALLAAAVLKGKKIKVIGMMVLGGGLAITLLFAVQYFTGEKVLDSGVGRLGQTFSSTGTTEARLRAIPYMIGEWTKRPILGVSYRELYQIREALSSGVSASASILHPHNFVLRALVQYGLVGVLLLFLVIGHSLLTARRIARVPQTQEIGAFLFASQVYFLIFATMNTAMGSAGFFYWILVGFTFWYMGRANIPPEVTESAPPRGGGGVAPILARKRRAMIRNL